MVVAAGRAALLPAVRRLRVSGSGAARLVRAQQLLRHRQRRFRPERVLLRRWMQAIARDELPALARDARDVDVRDAAALALGFRGRVERVDFGGDLLSV